MIFYCEDTLDLMGIMYLLLAILYSLSSPCGYNGDYSRRNNDSSPVLIFAAPPHQGTCGSGCVLDVPLIPLAPPLPSSKVDLARAPSIMVLHDFFATCCAPNNNIDKRESPNDSHRKLFKQKCLILLLLLMSGNVQPNPGPDTPIKYDTPSDFKERSGLGFIHINVRSLVPKIDMLRIWAQSTAADVIVLSETWLSKSVSNKDIDISGYNVFRTDRPKRGGGIAIYIKNKFQVNVLLSKSVSKQFEFLALKLVVSTSLSLTVIGCYRPPSADTSALSALVQLLSDVSYKELILLGDLNLNWLHPISDELKSNCHNLNLFQIVDTPTRPNLKNPEKSSLIDVILTNVPHKYSTASIFANDISDHCAVATVRAAKLPKFKPTITVKRDMKHFSEQGFLHDLFYTDWEKMYAIADVDNAWDYFYEAFYSLVNKHAPFKKYRVNGRRNPWFTPDLSALLHERDLAWAKAKKSKLNTDWQDFRHLRNSCTVKIKKS